MSKTSRNNYIAIAKAIGIILMVVGHSGCPSALGRFIYLFHMPLFFVCSGYFFKEITNKASLIPFYKKKMTGLYVPYLKWSLLFLLLHNIFRYLYIIGSDFYHMADYVRQFAKLLVMTDYEILIRPFWFMKELLLTSIIVASFSLIRSLFFPKISIFFLLIISMAITFVAKSVQDFPLIGDCSLLFFSITYFYSGVLLQKYKDIIPFNTSMMIISFLIVLIGSVLYKGTIDMRFTTEKNIIPYYILSLAGVIMVLCISKKSECISAKYILYYIGNHTMPILALNLLALKLGNLIKIWIYDLPINNLSSHTVIYNYNTFYWLAYTMIGVVIPLLTNYLYNRFFSKYNFEKTK